MVIKDIDDIDEFEDNMLPKHSVDLIGLGRLGIRTGINLIQVHRGGPKEINVFDGQKISNADVIFTLIGGKSGDYKTEFFKKICTHSPTYREINAFNEYINDSNINLIKGNVVAIAIAGGNTIPISAKIIKHAHNIGSKTISTAGVFGLNCEKIIVKDISEFDNNNPAVEQLRKEGIYENHKIVTTNKFIKDNVPITPYVLDDVAKSITVEILKDLLYL